MLQVHGSSFEWHLIKSKTTLAAKLAESRLNQAYVETQTLLSAVAMAQQALGRVTRLTKQPVSAHC